MTLNLPVLKQPLDIAVVAPSGAPLNETAVVRGLDLLRQQGFRVHSYYEPEHKYQRFGATDEVRVRQIHAAASDPQIRVVMALRGSYGFSRLLPYLDLDLLAQSGKIFTGYSDFTLMHQLLLQRGVCSIAGPMLCDDYTRDNPDEYTLKQFADCLSSSRHQVEFASDTVPELDVQGVLWGGNLAMLAHVVGTPYAAAPENGILFLEDIGEHPYRVERMLLQLHYAGILEKQKAILLGDFSGYRLAEHDNGYDFAAMLTYLRSLVRCPVLTGLPFGHIRERATLVVGSQARLTAKEGIASLVMCYQW
ncbi:LD-carboxypeptidase [Undibacterium sp. FT31W]|uniref:LD-carboxypeptidase n=1 Tax=Undibacterium griseum TaxID=2762295 RepID=A0ABR6YM33_9BURK|nr:LD-carboxypeptidase [Undibacterium griseum]MBC3884957.1 LD-carboxypeptidase [Undibacterium griseum]